MKAEVWLRIHGCRVHGELNSEVEEAPGEPCFIPWRSICGLRQDQVYRVSELPDDSEILVRHPGQEGRVLAAVAELGISVSVAPPRRRPLRRTVSVNVEASDYRKACQLAERDGLSLAAWIRSVLRRELIHRRV